MKQKNSLTAGWQGVNHGPQLCANRQLGGSLQGKVFFATPEAPLEAGYYGNK